MPTDWSEKLGVEGETLWREGRLFFWGEGLTGIREPLCRIFVKNILGYAYEFAIIY